ncbi:N-acetyl-gamma-glutamyl-phosphate reductase [Pseudoblastomonas halimionae]|uniref:N-acetyl-gamma-glutamyl-phosphate reductase n=1 Tax=Alteriqipengyuania halimionae TaxID=1926630 RepID=UPI002D7FCE98|nr:N-acetyl-gamma-glutamyl-phosphate reductase [Alteriqipengyuania halimionae]
MIEVFVDGAAGTTGLEIVQRLEAHPEFVPVQLDEERRKDREARREALNAAEFAVLCLPDVAAKDAIALIDDDAKVRIVDASSAHRTATGWTYGFPEIGFRDAIREARLVSNPGCYPTGFLAGLAPLVKAGMLPADWPYGVHAVSGYSGGGKTLVERFEDDDCTVAWRGYATSLEHKHLPEMRQHAGLAHAPIFSPAVVPAFRGMVVEVPLPLDAMTGTSSVTEMRKLLAETYRDSRVIRFLDSVPDEIIVERDTASWDGLVLRLLSSDDDRRAKLVATLDNLGKGASGAAVQNLNLMAGIAEETGLKV